jgi:hypothetical protein
MAGAARGDDGAQAAGRSCRPSSSELRPKGGAACRLQCDSPATACFGFLPCFW